MTYIRSRWEAVNSTPAKTGANFTGGTDLYFKYNLALNERIIGDKCFLVLTDALNANGATLYSDLTNVSATVDDLGRSVNAGNVWNIARALNHVPAYFSQIDMLYSSKVLTSQQHPQMVDTIKKRLRYNEDYLNSTFSTGNWKSLAERRADCSGSAGAKGAIKTWTWNLNDCLGPMDDVLNPGLYEFRFKIDSDFQNKVLESGGKRGPNAGDIITFPPDSVTISVEDVQLYLYIVETVEQPDRKFKISFTENQFSPETSGLAGTSCQITSSIKPKTKRITVGFQNTQQNTSRFFRSTEMDTRNLPFTSNDTPAAGTYFDFSTKLRRFRIEHAGQKYPNNEWDQDESGTSQKGSRVMYYIQQLSANKDLNPGGAAESFDKWKNSRLYTFETVKREDNLDSQLKINDIQFSEPVPAGTLRCCILSEYKKTFEVELNESFGVTNVAEV